MIPAVLLVSFHCDVRHKKYSGGLLVTSINESQPLNPIGNEFFTLMYVTAMFGCGVPNVDEILLLEFDECITTSDGQLETLHFYQKAQYRRVELKWQKTGWYICVHFLM